MQNKIFLYIAFGTTFILLIPFLAMQLNWQFPDPGSSTNNRVNWTISDFVVMGTLLFVTGSTFVLAARKFPKHQLIIGLIIGFLFLWLWAELAVGIFTNWGS